MKFVVEVDIENAAFDPDPVPELARLLRYAADAVEVSHAYGVLSDINGNKVGEFRLEST